MTYFSLVNTRTIQKPNLESSRAQVGRHKVEFHYVCLFGHFDPIKQKFAYYNLIGHPDIPLTQFNYI